MKGSRIRLLLPLAVLLSQALPAAWAQAGKDGRTVAQVATYEGADRQARLLDGAKKEGELSVYYAHPIVKDMAEAFTRKHGIKVKLWRAGSEAIMQRIFAESRAGRHEVDVFLSTSADTEAAAREIAFFFSGLELVG